MDGLTDAQVHERIYEGIGRIIFNCQQRIFKLLYEDVIQRVPEDTGHLRSVIETYSKILTEKIVIGSGTIVPYAHWLEHHFDDPENPAHMWPAKYRRLIKEIAKKGSTLPYLRTAVYKNLENIKTIIVEEIQKEFAA